MFRRRTISLTSRQTTRNYRCRLYFLQRELLALCLCMPGPGGQVERLVFNTLI